MIRLLLIQMIKAKKRLSMRRNNVTIKGMNKKAIMPVPVAALSQRNKHRRRRRRRCHQHHHRLG